MQILDVDHVQITVAPDQVSAAEDFYFGVLGFLEIEKPEALKPRGGFWMLAGHTPVHIGIEKGFERTQTKAHVAYAVDDLSQWRRHLLSNGIEPIESVAIPGCDRFEFQDPFGNRVELIQSL